MDEKTLKYILKKYIDEYGLDLYKKGLKEYENISLNKQNEIAIEKANQTDKSFHPFNNDGLVNNKILWTEPLIKKYLDLFFSRKEVYATFWESGGKTGYSFSCKNEWTKNICLKLIPNSGGCKNCQFKKYAPIDTNNIKEHLLGNKVFGTYVSSENSQTKFLVFDFDDVQDIQFIKDLIKICNLNNIKLYIELSKSKEGFHLWIFFDDFISNVVVRKFGMLLITLSINISNNISFKYFDRIFPAQDFITKNGLGNLVRLPLSKSDVLQGRCVFLDYQFNPISDQLKFFENIQINNSKWIIAFLNKNVNNLISSALENKNNLINDKELMNTNQITINLDSQISFQIDELNPSVFKWLIFTASFVNTDYLKKQRMRISVWNIPYIISTYSIENNFLCMPKGLLIDIINVFKKNKIKYKILKNYKLGKTIQIETNFKLTDIQNKYFLDLIKENTGVLIAPTGSGKTLIGINLIKHFKKSTLIIVDKIVIAKHWKAMLMKYTNLDEKDIDLNKNKKAKVMIRTYQSINNETKLNQFNDVGLTIIDECHHSAAYNFENLIKKIPSKYLYGFTATFKRYDNLEKIVKFLFGNIIEIPKELIPSNARKILKIIPTTFSVLHSKNKNLAELHKQLVQDENRNILISKLLLNLYQNDKKTLVLTEWVEHVNIIHDMIKEKIPNVVILNGQMTKKELSIELQKAELEIPKIILATGKFLGEGFDLESIDSLVNIFPFSFSGKLKQYVGRIREKNKNNIFVFDFFDQYVHQYTNMFSKRLTEYKKLGFELVEDNKNPKNQFIFTISNFLDHIKIDFNNAKSRLFIKSNENIFLQQIMQNFDSQINSYEIKENTSNDINAIVLDKRITWLISGEFILRIESEKFSKEIVKSCWN